MDGRAQLPQLNVGSAGAVQRDEATPQTFIPSTVPQHLAALLVQQSSPTILGRGLVGTRFPRVMKGKVSIGFDDYRAVA